MSPVDNCNAIIDILLIILDTNVPSSNTNKAIKLTYSIVFLDITNSIIIYNTNSFKMIVLVSVHVSYKVIFKVYLMNIYI